MGLLEIYKQTLLSYKGVVTVDAKVFFSSYLKQLLSTNEQLFLKIYKVFVEINQNVALYSADRFVSLGGKDDGVGEIRLLEYEDSYQVRSKNIVKAHDGEILRKRCEELNAMDREVLRDLKRQTRGEAGLQDKGAHIGLMHMRLVSDNRLSCSVEPINENESFFSLSVKINK